MIRRSRQNLWAVIRVHNRLFDLEKYAVLKGKEPSDQVDWIPVQFGGALNFGSNSIGIDETEMVSKLRLNVDSKNGFYRPRNGQSAPSDRSGSRDMRLAPNGAYSRTTGPHLWEARCREIRLTARSQICAISKAELVSMMIGLSFGQRVLQVDCAVPIAQPFIWLAIGL